LAELRSFIIGVAVAAALLGFGAFMLGAFDGPGEGAPSLVVASTPGDANSVDVPAPTSSAGSPVPASPSGTPSPTPRPERTEGDRTTCDAIVGTPFRSDRERDFFLASCTHLLLVPTPVPGAPGGPGYKGNASRLVADLGLQISYLADRATQPAVEDANWRQFSNQAIQNVHNIAQQIEGLSVPACGAQAHQAVVPAAQQSRAAADQLNQAIIASSNDAVARTINALAAARGQVSQAAGAVERALC
jgi:hypothetical protein